MRALASQGEVLDVPAGQLIFSSGETGDCMFGVLEGSVELSWNEEGGQEIIQAGDVFGAGALERAAAEQSPAPALALLCAYVLFAAVATAFGGAAAVRNAQG